MGGRGLGARSLPRPVAEAGASGGRGERWVPVFSELHAYLEAAFEQGPEGTTHVVRRCRVSSTNLRTPLNRIIKRAGLTPWPKSFHDLRATRQTELAAEFPMHVVCPWMCNQEAFAMQHHLQVTDDDLNRAAQNPVHATVEPRTSH